MSFYDNDASWAATGRQSSWEQQQQQQTPPQSQQQQQQPPSRSGTGSSMSQQSDSNAFASQFEEIERATDNLMKSGKWFPGPMQSMAGAAARHTPAGPMGRGYDVGGDPRMGGGPPRQSSGSDYDNARPGSAGLQGYYQGQRFPTGRPSEAEQMLQAKRRMAAQRERELRNYHQEQQYNRTVSGVKPDRSLSPNTMSEEDRRDLIARQHRALYGDNSSLYGVDPASSPRPSSQDVRASQPGRGASPLAFDPYGVQSPSTAEGAVQMPPRDHVNSATSPASNPTTQQSFGLMSGAQQSSRTSTSSPNGGGAGDSSSPPPGTQQGGKAGTPSAGVAPIGTRPIAQQTASNQRATTPLTPSALSYGFSSSENPATAAGKPDERSTSASSNPAMGENNKSAAGGGLGAWGANSGVWGSGKNLAVQPSVWG